MDSSVVRDMSHVICWSGSLQIALSDREIILSRFDDLVITMLCQCLFLCNKQDSNSLTEYGLAHLADQHMLGPSDMDCMDENAIVKLQYDMM